MGRSFGEFTSHSYTATMPSTISQLSVHMDVKAVENKPETIYDWGSVDPKALTDVLHRKTRRPQKCTHKCMGSAMDTSGSGSNEGLPLDQKLVQAEDFLSDYYKDAENHVPPAMSLEQRLPAVTKQLKDVGYYDLTADELEWGARTAWRNAPRCPARVVWKKLTVFDCRKDTTTDGMFAAICRHLEVSLNMGNIQPAITIFRERRPGLKDIRVWNNLVVSFAGYEQEDGSYIGDPTGVDLTKIAEGLGWRGAGGRFDLLPWILSGEDGEPKLYDIPQKYIDNLPLTVDIKHPTIKAIGEMGLKWFTLPGVASMMAEIGGVQFPAAPFAGWYQETEISGRDLLDTQRYNLLEPLGEAMQLDMSSNTTLWKDTVALELNKAVLDSYKNAQVSIVDHYTQADQFMEHMAAEYKTRGGCPADWVWIVPPQSGSLVPTYHQEMLRYNLSPSFEYQEKPWLSYNKQPRKLSFKALGWTMLLGQSIFHKLIKQRKKVAILYGTETGQSKRFANQAMDIFMSTFRCTLLPLDNNENMYKEIEASDIAIFISSTFGSGEAPAMSLGFDSELRRLLRIKYGAPQTWLQGLNFAVFGLGSSAYVDLAAFGHFLDTSLTTLGCKQLTPLGVGDELKNQKGSFQAWVTKAFKAAIKLFNINVPEQKLNGILKTMHVVKQFKWDTAHSDKRETVGSALAAVYNQRIVDVTLTKRTSLHNEKSEPSTMLLDFTYENQDSQGPTYQPGDHLGLFPANRREDIEMLRSRMSDLPPSKDEPLILLESTNGRFWRQAQDFPQLLRCDDLMAYVVDISRLPDQDVLRMMMKYAGKEDKEKLDLLVTDQEQYETWAKKKNNLCDALREFPSVSIPSAEVLGHVPSIQNRLYSIASTMNKSKDKVSLVVGVDEIKKEGDERRFGLCSGLLQNVGIGTKFPAFFKTANFRLPEDPSKPVIMVAAGSGIAPFRGFWQDRERKAKEGFNVGPTILIFGCRKKSMDLLKEETDKFGDEEEGWLRSFSRGPKMTRVTAMSKEEGEPRNYVQDLVEEHRHVLNKLWLEAGGSLYVCGKVAMAVGVQESLVALVRKVQGVGKEEADAVIDKCREEGRYQEDIFTA